MADEEDKDTGSPRTPEYHMSDEDVEGLDVEYSIRAPEDFVISGPLGALGGGPGRRFATAEDAKQWVHQRYPGRVKHRIQEASNNSCNRWAFLIKEIK